MKQCFRMLVAGTILWVLVNASEPIRGRTRARASHVMRGFGKFEMFPTSIELFHPCKTSYDCLLYIPHSRCEWSTFTCTCQPYFTPFNNTMCLPPSLLGYGCVLDKQCSTKVANSVCVDGTCECTPDHMPLRKDKCLPPAKIEDYCLSDKQCQLANTYSYCKYIIPRIYGKCKCPLDYMLTEEGHCLPHLGSQCRQHQDCEAVTPNSFCLRAGRTAYCECREGFQISPNKMKCIPVEPLSVQVYMAASLGKVCHSDVECRMRDPYSVCKNGTCDCILPDENCGSHHPGCHPDTFQCHTGYCISWYFVCDKQKNCPDNSDEDLCIPFNCPQQAFQCDDGTCLAKSLVCNGRWECPDGSDEARCYKGIPCDRNAYQCRNGQCLPQYTFCNAVKDCADGSDELSEVCDAAGYNCPKNSFQCNNGQCRSSAILCSGLDGCGDDSDEINCEVCTCKKP